MKLSNLKRVCILLVVLGVATYASLVIDYNRAHPQDAVVAATAAPARSVDADPLEMYKEVNRLRQDAGVPLLSYNQALVRSATDKCNDMVAGDYYGHDNPTTGKTGYEYIFDEMDGTTLVSENLNKGVFANSKDVVSDPKYGWVGSEPHKKAMLDPRYTDTGLSTCRLPSSPDEIVAVEHFAVVSR